MARIVTQTTHGAVAGVSSEAAVRCQAPTVSGNRSGMVTGLLPHADSTSTTSRRIGGRIISHDATIGFMGKFKPVRAGGKKASRPQGAAGCVVMILLIMIGVMVFLYLVMTSNANR